MTLYQAPQEVSRIQRGALLIGLASMGTCGIGAIFWLDQFLRSYLLGYVFWVGIALGCLAIVMLQHLTGGAWGFVVRRLLESASATLPLMAVLFLPLLLGLQSLYGWARPEEVAGHASLQHKAAYLNIPFFLIRTVIYFGAWALLARFLTRWSHQQDRSPDPLWTLRLQKLSGPGLVLYALTVTFASVDWVMSLEPEWFSTIFGLLFIGGQALSGLAFVIAAASFLSQHKPLAGIILPSHFHDLGKLLLALVMIWAYFAFSQFLIVWSGNLPEEIPWYLHRMQGGWKWVGLALVLFHFVLPFLVLLSRDLKRDARVLVIVALAVVFMRFVDLLWLTAPPLVESILIKLWLDFGLLMGLGGIWIAFFIWHLKGRPLLPLKDSHLRELLDHGHE
jgi:hypothetical protein